MIRFFAGVTQFFVCLCCISIFASLFLVSLAVFDYIYDTDLKKEFCSKWNKPKLMTSIRNHVLKSIDNLDKKATENEKFMQKVTDPMGRDIFYVNRLKEEK